MCDPRIIQTIREANSIFSLNKLLFYCLGKNIDEVCHDVECGQYIWRIAHCMAENPPITALEPHCHVQSDILIFLNRDKLKKLNEFTIRYFGVRVV